MPRSVFGSDDAGAPITVSSEGITLVGATVELDPGSVQNTPLSVVTKAALDAAVSLVDSGNLNSIDGVAASGGDVDLVQGGGVTISPNVPAAGQITISAPPINDAAANLAELWSASKISGELAGKAASVHTHAGEDITSGTVATARLDVGVGAGQVAAGSHTHAGSDIVSGTVAFARLPTGVGAAEVAVGNHVHSGADITSGTVATARLDVGAGAGQVAAGDHTHDGAAIVSGTVAFARLPTGSGAAQVAVGNHTHDAGDVVSGTLAVARLPTGLTASDVIRGDTLNDALELSTNLWSAQKIRLEIDTVAAGLDPKESCRAATTPAGGNVDLATGTLLTIDGEALAADDRVLVKNQSDPKENGIYLAKAGAWVRSADMDGSPASEVSGGNFTFVCCGAVNGDTGWVLQGDGVQTLGVDNIDWVQFSSAANLTASDGVQRVGNDFRADATVLRTADKGAANGVCGLDAGGLVLFSDLPTGTGAAQVAVGNHTHAGSDITSGTVPFARLPTGVGAAEVAVGNHVHSGADITSGTVATARLDVGAGATQVAAGDHTHTNLTLTGGTINNVVIGATTPVEGNFTHLRTDEITWQDQSDKSNLLITGPPTNDIRVFIPSAAKAFRVYTGGNNRFTVKDTELITDVKILAPTVAMNPSVGGEMLIDQTEVASLRLNVTDVNQSLEVDVGGVQRFRVDSDDVRGSVKFSTPELNIIAGPSKGSGSVTMGDGTNNFTLTTGTYRYQKWGDMVYVQVVAIWTSKGIATGSIRVSLPFAVDGNPVAFRMTDWRVDGDGDAKTDRLIIARAGSGNSFANFHRQNGDDGATLVLDDSNFGNAGTLRFNGSYFFRS